MKDVKELITQAIVDQPATREKNYRQLIESYYELVTDIYRKDWGDSFHFALFQGSEKLSEAMVATERMIADEGGFRPGMKILDVGCGVGGPTLNIAEYSGAHITGVNIIERHIEIARERAAERGLCHLTEFLHTDAMNMPFADNSFDAVYIFEAGCHMPDKAAFYKECARVLRPGGVFLGLDWMRKEGLTPQEEQKYIEPICKCCAIPHMVTLPELSNYLSNAGLLVEVLDDLADHGNILRNWELLDNKIVQGIHDLVPWLIPPVLRMLTDGGYALLDGVKAGAFIIGHWRTSKPNFDPNITLVTSNSEQLLQT
jgi:sterol 24-C-methyltransferase